MNKTTSFSKLKNKKNDNLLLLNNTNNNNNNNNQQTLYQNIPNLVTTPTSTTTTKESFFIDSINDSTKSNLVNDKSTNLLFEPAPVELFADSIIEEATSSSTSNSTSNRLNLVPTIELSQYSDQRQQTRLKNWNSESNLARARTRKKLVKLNKSCIHKNENEDDDGDNDDDDDELRENSESYYDYDLENDPLQFSDHAGLFDTYENEESGEHDDEDDEQNDDSNLLNINNYDVYKAAKHNYKLTYNNDDNHSLFALDKLVNTNNNRKLHIDSLINSDLMMQQQSRDVDDVDDEDEEEDDEENYNNSINQTESNYLYYLNKLTNQEQSQISNSNLNDSIMNWSMKISNYNYTNHYQQQKQHIEYQLNQKVKRSQSRSPERSSAIPRSNSSFSKLYFTNIKQQQQQQQHQSKKQIQPQQQNLSNKSTTSWGKLKHSKSSSTNFVSQQTQQYNLNETSTSNQYDDYDDSSSDVRPLNFLESVHVNRENLIKQPLSSPSLFRLFQNSKSTNPFKDLNSSSEANSFMSNQQQRINRRTDLKPKEEESPKITKTTSFSQIRQRSLSSCAIGQTHLPESSPQSPQLISSALSDQQAKQNLVVVVDTTKQQQQQQEATNKHLIKSKKSIGVQHPASNQIDQSIQTSTIVCMLVDRNNSKTSKELIEVAARAARAAVAARRSYNLFSTKSSLPDLTFLKEYGDENKKNTAAANLNTYQEENNNKLGNTLCKQKELDESLITNNLQLKNSLSSANLIKPISDLIKLDELAIKKTLTNQPTATNPTITGSELLKRKTLKSIKRYRQTKQNTEPCNLLVDQNVVNESFPTVGTSYHSNEPNRTKLTLNNNNNNSASSSTSSSSGATNTSGYVSNAATNLIQQQQSDKSKQPLKSCLKRKDSTNSSTPQQQQQQSQASKPKLNSTSSLIVTKPNQANTSTSNITAKKSLEQQKKTSTLMFLPYVGYLYTWDQSSSTRYVYYNNLERVRRVKTYKQIIRNSLEGEEDDEEEEEEDEDVTKEEAKQANEPQMVTSSRSYNDLRVKKSVTFLSHVIEHKQQQQNTPKKRKPISPSSTIETTSTTTGTLSTSSSTNSTKQTSVSGNRSSAPLLQYDALIAMLKSNSLQRQSGLDVKTLHKQSPQLVSKTKHLKVNNSFSARNNRPGKLLERQNSSGNEANYFKKSQVIDADSISLASLSESPPSEFKFSDDEDYNTNSAKLDEHLNHALSSNKSFNTNTTNSSSATSSSSAGSSSSTNLASNNINNNNSNNNKVNHHHQQLMKFNQMELIRNKKKNFHSILLKDTKLNNLKEILLEIKEQQQKLIQLANESKTQKEAALISTAASLIAGGASTSSTKLAYDSTISMTLNQTSILATTSTDNTVSIELRDTIERLAQYLFEFLKQGLKPATFDQLAQANLSSSSIKTHTTSSPTITTPAMSPAPVERALPDSSSLTLIYSQYTQLWNLIEHTISMNLAATTQQSELTFQCFKLPKEAYLNMYQEINSYSNNTNHTYLIDSGINTSQLRRKHHFMVNLMSLKFKFQLFIINLLNYKQLANWFEYLNRDKATIKKFYDLKTPISNINGDSGVGEFICMSGSSSSTNSSMSNLNSHQANTANLLALLSLTSLAHVSIFENEEYFSYFHKLVQQFNFIEFNLKISKQMDKSTSTPRTASPISTPKITSKHTPQSPRKSSSSLSRHHTHTQATSIPISPSTPQNFNHSNQQQQQQHHSSHSVFKNISKRLNIKSWFTSSSHNQQQSQHQPQPNISSTLPNHHQTSSINNSNNNNKSNPSTPQVSSQQSVYKKTSQAPNTNKLVGTKSKGTAPVLISGPLNKLLNSTQLMKHSCSEPSLNEIIE